MRRLQRVHGGQNSRAVQEVPGLPVLGNLLLRLHVFAVLAADALGAGLASLLALTVSVWMLHAAQVTVGRAERGRQSGAERPYMHGRTSYQVVLVHQTHDVVMHSLLCNVSGQPVHVVSYFPVGEVVQ